ncbi:MAG TPA: hypothetical protein VJ881_09110 [Halanaerobiales bacterium]|nr:hypothetical protein [Halanaerobiales bacterium]
MNFKRLTEEVFSLYTQEKYNQALEVVQKAKSEYPEKLHKTSYWAACLYNKLNRHKEAIDELKNTFNKDFWWAPKLLTEDPDLEPLNDKQEFKELISKCKKLRDERQSNAKPILKVLSPDKKKNRNYPLLIILHGRNGNIKEFSKYWTSSYLRDNYLLAFFQSSQVFGMKSYCWDDVELAKKEVKEQYNNLVQNYEVDTNNVIIAGDNDYYYKNVKKLYKGMNELDYPIKLITEKGMGHYLCYVFCNEGIRVIVAKDLPTLTGR